MFSIILLHILHLLMYLASAQWRFSWQDGSGNNFSLCKQSLQCFLSHPGSLCIFMYECRWENGAGECCFCSMGGGNAWTSSWIVSTKTSSFTHLSAPSQRAIQLLTVIQGQLKAIGMEKHLCMHVWAHVCSPVSLKKLSRLASVSLPAPQASPCASSLFQLNLPQLTICLSWLTHSLALI